MIERKARVGDHVAKLHDPKTANLIGQAAQRFLKTLGKSLGARGVIITVEQCGCMSINSSLSEEEATALLMKVLSTRDDGEVDH